MSAAHDSHAEHSGQPHSHKAAYIRLGILLTVVTAVELALPFLKTYPQIWDAGQPMWMPLLVALSVFKFGAVVGEFMHLRGDRGIYKFLFLSPLAIAATIFLLLSTLAMRLFLPFGEGLAVTAKDVQAGYVKATKSSGAEPPLADEKFNAAFADAKSKQFVDGKAVFVRVCKVCHGDMGEGKPALGLNLTDDCYKYGGTFKDLYTSVADGRAGNKMPSQGSTLKSEEIRQVVYYVRSLKGTNVAGEPCVGDKVAD
ncbi:MAG: c-type cytochrome [Myxococcales bacterium]|nr:c-type cytochrome [Myxococcales bacterium]